MLSRTPAVSRAACRLSRTGLGAGAVRGFSASAAALKERIGWIGTGVMGSPMCQHLMDAGYSATVYNRTASKCDGLAAAGARVASSPREVAENSDVVFSIVGTPADVESVILGADGVFDPSGGGLAAGGVLVEMTTSSPSLAREIAEVAAARGCSSLDAPVSGGDVGARNGTLAVMVGGEEDALARVAPLLGAMSSKVTLMGPAGAGQMTKAVNQTVIANNMMGMAEGLVLATRAGLNPFDVVDAIGGGAAASFSLTQLGPRAAKGDLDPGFFVEHFVKDLGIALGEAERLGLQLRGMQVASELYAEMMKNGQGKRGTQALVQAVEALARKEGPSVVGFPPRS
ncbi:hypothetical protein FNF27_01702 [Cafeteria roenbergensis]|uniref:6-phosphogluconate dehydrogenase NADP-binding domain-containing protein n=2 Tax=Cafeteria roenbergensis TaxID=33653 RepID=A0A5A8DV70_CAFRO|nr:hypothetical protein FNF29_03892 [Cafeteria roenbergensis]KAA0167770.1 hypothetical protein FNF31_00705 [Cafeteria roenbergensis]KAA0171687.1 hypothetical protein FNF28_00620 [Cafeteria roenbergensis]KAA0176880.1 hypothetical protein FNF27_01702 [Cafeteria roenbergensis]|eukprot:KAA0152326.1 hypothetical protein FNF29_03892 [Cafeteria roenbergensis]